MFDGMTLFGGLVVRTPPDLETIPVEARSLDDAKRTLTAYAIKQEDGSWIAHFPVVPAGNWMVSVSYVYNAGLKAGKLYGDSKVVTVFPGGAVSQVVLQEKEK